MRPHTIPFFLALLCPAGSLVAEAPLSPGDANLRENLGRPAPVVALWPEGARADDARDPGPEELRTSDRNRTGLNHVRSVTEPTFTVMGPPPKANTGVAVLLCPGGGYGILDQDPPLATARFLNERGITAVFLKYRVPNPPTGDYGKGLHALQDAQRAIRLLRHRAAEWGIDSQKIGIGGFSAGGHLSAAVSRFEGLSYEAIDAADGANGRPDFVLLLYPAYLTEPILSRALNPNLATAGTTPPTFIAITMPDKFTIGSVEYALALRRAKVPSELHVYPTGGHGGAFDKYPLSEWGGEFHRWLGDIGMLKPATDPQPLEYGAAALPPTDSGDEALVALLGEGAFSVPVWPGDGMGPDETLEPGPETVTHKSKGGTALNITRVTRPSITVSLPDGKEDAPPRRAVLVCPGGAYGGLAAEHEGVAICRWLNRQGIAGILLKYRVPRRGGEYPKHHHAHQDAQRAMRLVRAKSEEWNLDPEQVGVLGFSAGGHLAATLMTAFETPAYPARDEIDVQGSRPDFAVLVYPAYLTLERDANDLDPALTGTLQRNRTPPVFLTVARDDSHALGAYNYLLALREAKVPAELHVYQSGGHGGGMDPSNYPFSQWTEAAERWLLDLGGDPR